MTPWDHQTKAVTLSMDAVHRGIKRICETTPTGGGKTWIMQELCRRALAERKRVALYTNRSMLLEQTSEKFNGERLWHGIRARGYDPDLDCALQLCMIQTITSRCIKKKAEQIPPADLVLIDEFHLNSHDSALEILNKHLQDNPRAAYIGFTATPLDLDHAADELIVAGTNSELRACNALMMAEHYGPDEPDIRAFKRLQASLDSGENPSEKEVAKAMMTPSIMSRVWDHFNRLNPEHKPTILFAPGVNESVWFAQQFNGKGVRSAHIDGEDVWIDGELHKTSTELRQEVMKEHKSGAIKVLCNRFVLREGIDAPWLAHGIVATMFGSLASYLQSLGRLLRYQPGMDHVTIQDHGGNWWRHGSINSDREWSLDMTSRMVAGVRADRIRKKIDKQPFACPKCGKVWLVGRECTCGYFLEGKKLGRPVVSTDGSLKYMTDPIFKPRRVSQDPTMEQLWIKMYHRSCTWKGDRTPNAAAALFAYENNWLWPNPSWKFMPVHERDNYIKFADIPRERLR